MTAPLDARNIANQNGTFSPQHVNNWMLEISGLTGSDDKDLILLSLMNTNIPTSSNDVVETHYGNESRKSAGKAKFEAIPLSVHDYVDMAVRLACENWRKAVYDPATGIIGQPSAYKKTCDLILVSPDGVSTRTYQCVGLWPSKLEGGSLDMSKSDHMEIKMTLEVDLMIPQFTT